MLLKRYSLGTTWVEDVFVLLFPDGRRVRLQLRGRQGGVIRALDIELRYVSPNVWKNNLGCSANKQTSRDRAKQLFPFQTKLLRSEAKCEAGLIALYGMFSTSSHIEAA
jgi:hypothetical protein